jgi:uncharacterized membrane protein
MRGGDLELWKNGPRVGLPDRPSDYTHALTYIGGIAAGIGIFGSFVWWLCYYLPFRAMSCSDGYDGPVVCHRVMNDAFAYVFDGVVGAVLFTVMMSLLTIGLRNLRK